jgi:hypothetical protein
MRKRTLTSGLTAFILFAVTFSAALPAYASTGTSASGGNFFSGLVQFISQKFGLDQTQVKSAVQDYEKQQKANRPMPSASQIQAMQQKMQNAEKKRLDMLVTQGKITADQETAIIAELNTLRTKYMTNTSEQTKVETQTQREQNFKNMESDWTTWAKNNNIDPALITPGPMMEPGSFGRGHGFEHKNWVSPTPTVTPMP